MSDVAATRAELRKRHLDAALARARREASAIGLSPKCRDGRHASDPGGCANDGSSCLCECHDATAPKREP